MLNASFWLAISFCIFVSLAYRPIKNALFKYLDNEIANVVSSLSDARTLKEEAEEMVNSLKLSIEALEQERLAIMKTVEEQNNLLIATQQKELDLMMQRREKETIDRIDQLTIEATDEIKNTLSRKSAKLVENYISNNRKSFPSDKEIASFSMKSLP